MLWLGEIALLCNATRLRSVFIWLNMILGIYSSGARAKFKSIAFKLSNFLVVVVVVAT